MDDFVVNVKQITQYPMAEVALPQDTLLLQRNGLGGPYAGITAAALVSTALEQGGPMAVGVDIPPDAADAQVITGIFSIYGPGNGILWNAYNLEDIVGGQARLAPGVAAMEAFDVNGFTLRVAASGGAGDVLDGLWQAVLNVNMDGHLWLLDQVTVGRPAAAPNELTTWAQTLELRELSVWSFNGRTGDITLTLDDITDVGGAPAVNPTLTDPVLEGTIYLAGGVINVTGEFLAPTMDDPSNRSGYVATTAFVQCAIEHYAATHSGVAGGGCPPTDPPLNQLWWDDQAKQLYVWDGTNWVIAVNQRHNVIDSPHFTGEPTAPTPGSSDNSNRLATTAFVQRAIKRLRDDLEMQLDDLTRSVSDLAAAPPTVPTDPIAPDDPENGTLWFNPDTGLLMLWDGDQWIVATGEFLPLGGGTLTGNLMMLGGTQIVLTQDTPGLIPVMTASSADGTVVDNYFAGHFDSGIWQVNWIADFFFRRLNATTHATVDTPFFIQASTGMVFVDRDPTAPLQVANKRYVDNQVAQGGGGGGTGGGAFVSDNPPDTPDIGAQWFNTSTLTLMVWDGAQWGAAVPGGESGPFLPEAGGTLTGPLILAADPVDPLEAATKQYVDFLISEVTGIIPDADNFLPLTGGTLTGNLTIAPPAGAGAQLTFNRPGSGSGTGAIVYGQVAAHNRWAVALGNGDPESGQNAGSNFALISYDDTGALISSVLPPFSIQRSNGLARFYGGEVDIVAPATGPVPGTPVPAQLVLNSLDPAGYNQIVAQKQGLDRWSLTLGTVVAETGGNNGSDFSIYRYDDGGNVLDVPLFIRRTDGQVRLDGSVVIQPTGAPGVPTSATLYLNKPSGQNWNGIVGLMNGAWRWAINPGNSDLESGGNQGSNFVISRYDDAGNSLGTSLMITRVNNQFLFYNAGAVRAQINPAAGTMGVLNTTGIVRGILNQGTVNLYDVNGAVRWTMTADGPIELNGFNTGSTQTVQMLGQDSLAGGLLQLSNVNGNVGFLAQASTGSVSVTANGYKPGGGPWTDSSDIRIKTVDQNYEHGLAEIVALQPVVYHFNGNDAVPGTPQLGHPDTNRQHVGLVAQDVEDVLPECVTQVQGQIDGETVQDLRILDTGPLIYALVNAVKTLHARVRALEMEQSGGDAQPAPAPAPAPKRPTTRRRRS